MQYILTEIKHVRSAQKYAHRGAGKALRACEAEIQPPKNIQRKISQDYNYIEGSSLPLYIMHECNIFQCLEFRLFLY